MHPLRHPRNAALVGILFIVIAFFYWIVPTLGDWHVDYAGVTMLAALGVAMAMMAYVLVAGSRE
jgi:lipopolysaccharide export LptBFGC system permease protein LptF